MSGHLAGHFFAIGRGLIYGRHPEPPEVRAREAANGGIDPWFKQV